MESMVKSIIFNYSMRFVFSTHHYKSHIRKMSDIQEVLKVRKIMLKNVPTESGQWKVIFNMQRVTASTQTSNCKSEQLWKKKDTDGRRQIVACAQEVLEVYLTGKELAEGQKTFEHVGMKIGHKELIKKMTFLS